MPKPFTCVSGSGYSPKHPDPSRALGGRVASVRAAIMARSRFPCGTPELDADADAECEAVCKGWTATEPGLEARVPRAEGVRGDSMGSWGSLEFEDLDLE